MQDGRISVTTGGLRVVGSDDEPDDRDAACHGFRPRALAEHCCTWVVKWQVNRQLQQLSATAAAAVRYENGPQEKFVLKFGFKEPKKNSGTTNSPTRSVGVCVCVCVCVCMRARARACLHEKDREKKENRKTPREIIRVRTCVCVLCSPTPPPLPPQTWAYATLLDRWQGKPLLADGVCVCVCLCAYVLFVRARAGVCLHRII